MFIYIYIYIYVYIYIYGNHIHKFQTYPLFILWWSKSHFWNVTVSVYKVFSLLNSTILLLKSISYYDSLFKYSDIIKRIHTNTKNTYKEWNKQLKKRTVGQWQIMYSQDKQTNKNAKLHAH